MTTSFRTSFAERNSKTHELRKDSLFNLVDETKTGTIDKSEFSNLFDVIRAEAEAENNEKMAMAKKQAATKRKTKLFGCVAAVMGVFLAVSVAANFAVIFSVVDSAVKTTVSHTGFLEVKGSDKIVQTAEALVSVPMIAAPVLSFEELAATKTLKVKYMDGARTVQAQMNIAGVRKHNSTFVEFITTVPGEVVRQLNGVATLIQNPTFANKLTKPKEHAICSADADCSAFHTKGADADALVEKAMDELAGAGFNTFATHEGRKLYWKCIYTTICTTGVWETDAYENGDGSGWTGGGSGDGRVKDVTIKYFSRPLGNTHPNGVDAARHVVYLLHGFGGDGQGLFTNINSVFSQPEYVNFVFVFPTSCEVDPFGLGLNTWNSQADSNGAAGYNAVSFNQITSLYQWLGGNTGAYGVAVDGDVSSTIILGTNHPAAELSQGTDGISGCWSRQLAIGFSDGGRLAIQMNYFNRNTGIDSSVGIAGHPYLHVTDNYCFFGVCNSVDRYARTIYLMGSEQADNRCVGAGTGPWWCNAGLEGTRNGGFYGNDGHMNVRAHNYYAENDFFWAKGDDALADTQWWAAQREFKNVATQLSRCSDPAQVYPECSTWPYGGCDDPNSASNPCISPTTTTWPLYDSDNAVGGGPAPSPPSPAGTTWNGCGEGPNADQCKARRRTWSADCASGLLGDYCGLRMVQEIFLIGGACDGSAQCNGNNENTDGASGDAGHTGPWGGTGSMILGGTPSHGNFLSDGALIGSFLSDSVLQFITDMTGDGNMCGDNGDKFCCVPVQNTYAQSCVTNQTWVWVHCKPWDWFCVGHKAYEKAKSRKSNTIAGKNTPGEKGRDDRRQLASGGLPCYVTGTCPGNTKPALQTKYSGRGEDRNTAWTKYTKAGAKSTVDQMLGNSITRNGKGWTPSRADKYAREPLPKKEMMHVKESFNKDFYARKPQLH